MNLRVKAALITAFIVLSAALVLGIFAVLCIYFGPPAIVFPIVVILIWALYDTVYDRLRLKERYG